MPKVLDIVRIRGMEFSIGMLADEVVYHSKRLRIDPVASPKNIGEDENGMIVQWFYPDGITFTFKRTTVNGTQSYRISNIEVVEAERKDAK